MLLSDLQKRHEDTSKGGAQDTSVTLLHATCDRHNVTPAASDWCAFAYVSALTLKGARACACSIGTSQSMKIVGAHANETYSLGTHVREPSAARDTAMRPWGHTQA